nr:zinc finger-like domain-containing protein [Candidatus Magasanikbacteria bacterium]
MQFAQNDQLNILKCERCQGSGLGTSGKCSQCQGKGRAAWWNNELLYWNWPVSRYHISLRRGRNLLNTFRVMGGMIFAFSFIGLFVWNTYRLDIFTEIFQIDFWLHRVVQGKVFLWLGIIALGYVWYRIVLMGKAVE